MVNGQFMVCANLDVNLDGIYLINDFGISYDAKTQQVFSIANSPDILQTTGEVTIPAYTTLITTVKFTGEIVPFATPMATIASPPPPAPHLGTYSGVLRQESNLPGGHHHLSPLPHFFRLQLRVSNLSTVFNQQGPVAE